MTCYNCDVDGRSEEEELDRQLELIMSRRNEVVNSLHALPTSSSSPLGGRTRVTVTVDRSWEVL